jgi:transcriptional regulator with XRE-family HTH domain
MIATVHDFQSSGRMTDAEYEFERQRLREAYGDSSIEAAAKRDQAMATLFIRSGWTQEKLAQKEDVAPQRIAQRLRFGRFLNFSTSVENLKTLPNNLTEGKFRDYWSKTDKTETNERIRFRAVQALIAENTALRAQARPKIGKELVAAFGDGKWHSPDKMAARLDVEVDLVEATLTTMRDRSGGTYGANAERKKVGKGFHYRIFKKNKPISSSELVEKLTPIIEKLLVEGKKNAVTASPASVLILAGNLQQLLDEWTE